MTIYERLDDETRCKLSGLYPSSSIKPVVHRPKRKDKRKYSEREFKELMGVNRDRYIKVNGKVRRK